MFKWFRKKESIVLGGEIISSGPMASVSRIQAVRKSEYPEDKNKPWSFEVNFLGDDKNARSWAFLFRLKREAVEDREKLIIFYEKWR